MSNFTTELVSDLTAHIHPELVEYFENQKDILNFPWDSMEQLVQEILEDKYVTLDADIKYIHEKELDSRKKRRKNWCQKTEANFEKYPVDNPASYFYPLSQKISMNPAFYKEKYGTVVIREIAQKIIADLPTWRSSGKYLVTFPNFPNVGNIRISDILKNDVFINISTYMLREHNGSFDDFNLSTPLPFYDNAIFSAEKGKVNLPKDDVTGNKTVTMYISDDYELTLDIVKNAYSNDGKIPVFDATDKEILSYLINNVVIDIKNPSPLSQKQTVTLNSIATSIYKTKTTNQRQRLEIEHRLNQMVNPIRIENKKDGTTLNWTLLSSVVISKDSSGAKNVTYVLGDIISDSILTKSIVKVSSVKYGELENAYSKTLYCILQIERLKLAMNGKSMVYKYNYSFFKQKLLLRTKQIKRNIKTIESALQECIDKALAISSYELKDNDFILTFLPLSDMERDSLVDQNGVLMMGSSPALIESVLEDYQG